MQEEIDHEDDEEDGDNEGLDHIFHGGVQEVVAGFKQFEFQACRQTLFHLGQHLFDFGIHLCGIGTRRLLHIEHHARLSADVRAEVVGLGT